MDRSKMSSKPNCFELDVESLTNWHELMVERIRLRNKVFCDTLKTKMTNDINAYMYNLKSNTSYDTIQQDLINIVKGYDYDVASQTFIDEIMCAVFELLCQFVVFSSKEFIAKIRTALTLPSLSRQTPAPSKSHEKEVKMPDTTRTTNNLCSKPTAGRRQNLNQIISQSVLSNMSALNGGINLGDVSASINRGTACSTHNYVSAKSDSNNGIGNSTVSTASQYVSPNVESQAYSASINSCQTFNSLKSPQSNSQDSVLNLNGGINLGDVRAPTNRGTACSTHNYVTEKHDSNNDVGNSTVSTASQYVPPNVESQANSGSIKSCQTFNSLKSTQSNSQDSVLIIGENINTELIHINDTSPNINDEVKIQFRENVSSSNFLNLPQVKGEDDNTDSLFNTDNVVITDNSNVNTGSTILREATKVTEDSTTVNNSATDNNKSINENIANVGTSTSEKCDKQNSSKKASKKSKKPTKERHGILEKEIKSPTYCSNTEIHKKKKMKREKEKHRSKSKSKKDKSKLDKNKSLEFDNKVLSCASNYGAIVQSDFSNSLSVTDDLVSELKKKPDVPKSVNDNVACSENPATSEITDFEMINSDSTTKVQSTKDTFKKAELSKQREANVENKNIVNKKDKVEAINTKKQYERAKKNLFLPDYVISSVPKKCTNNGNENTSIGNENTNKGNENTIIGNEKKNEGNENDSKIISKPDSNQKPKTKKRKKSFSLLAIKRKKIHHECKVVETARADTPEFCQPEPLTNNNNLEHRTSCSKSDEQNIIYDCENSNKIPTSDNDKDTLSNENVFLNNDPMPEWMKELCEVHNIQNSYVVLTKLTTT